MHFMFTLDALLIIGTVVGWMGWDFSKPGMYDRDPVERAEKLKASKVWGNIAITCLILGVICILMTALAFDL